MVTVDDPDVGALLKAAAARVQPWEPLVGVSALAFRQFFQWGLELLGLQQFGIRPYSIRRGGAVHDFRTYHDVEHTLFRGRWSSMRVGRIYITEGAAALGRLRLPEATRAKLAELDTL